MIGEIAMKLRRSQHTSAIFGDRWTVVADAPRAIEYTALTYPAGYVTFLSDDAEPQPPGANENRQRVAQHWGVIVGLEATNDVRGQEPTQQIEAIRPSIFRAIYNWSPDEAYGPLWYEGTKLLEISRATTFWLMSFGAWWWVCGAEGDGETDEQFGPPAAVPFHGANIKVDSLQPHDKGLPPSQEYGPRHGPAPWATGPEGRIETEIGVEVPWQTIQRVVSLSNRRRGD